VGVCAVGDELDAKLLELVLERLCVLDDLRLVVLELLCVGLLEGDCQGGDGVVVRTALVAGEDGEVDGTLEVVHDLFPRLEIGASYTLAEEDHGATGTTQGLVGGGCDDVGVLEGGGYDTSSDQTRDVGHVDDEVGTDLVGDLSHASIVDETAVGRGTGDEDLGSVHEGVLLQTVVVDDASLEVDSVGESLEICRHGRDPGAGLVMVKG